MGNAARLSSDLSKRDIAYLLFKRKALVIRTFIATVVLVTIGTYLSDPVYEATATLYVVRNLPPIAATTPSSYNVMLERKEVLNSEVDLITSRAVAGAVAESLVASGAASLEPREPKGAVARAVKNATERARGWLVAAGVVPASVAGMDSLAESLRQGIKATPAVNSDFMTIRYRSSNPKFSTEVVNTFVDVYLQERLRLFQRPGLQEFYDEQIAMAERSLGELQKEMQALKAGTGVVTAEAEVKFKLEELSALNSELNQARSQTREASERVVVLRARLDKEPESVTSSRQMQRNPNVLELEKKRLELEAQKALELNRFQPDSAQIKEIDRSIEHIRATLAKEPATIVNNESVTQNEVRQLLLTELYRAESDQAAKVERVRALVEEISSLRPEVTRLDSGATALQRLATKSESTARIRARYVEQREEARIAAATDTGVTNVQVVSRSTPPMKPRFPRALLISLGIVLGVFFGLALAFVAELFAQTLDRRDDVERELGLPLLASIPDVRRLEGPAGMNGVL